MIPIESLPLSLVLDRLHGSGTKSETCCSASTALRCCADMQQPTRSQRSGPSHHRHSLHTSTRVKRYGVCSKLPTCATTLAERFRHTRAAPSSCCCTAPVCESVKRSRSP